MLARENFDGPHVWLSKRTFPQAVQKGRPARPQRAKGRIVPSGYVEGLSEARTKLADFFNSLLLRKRELGQLSLLKPLLHQRVNIEHPFDF